MKITTFNPQIITKDAEAVAKLFEALGFERRHNPQEIGELDVTGIRMKDANGFYPEFFMPFALKPYSSHPSHDGYCSISPFSFTTIGGLFSVSSSIFCT